MNRIKSSAPEMIFAGTSGLVLPVPNKQSYPEAFRNKSRLNYYASLYNTVEINSSFKKIPMAGTVEKWAADVPDNFRFTFKMPAVVTHNKNLAFNPADIVHFIDVVNHVGSKKGCLLVQFPGKLTIELAGELDKLIPVIIEANQGQWKIAIEFRHASWYEKDIYKKLHQGGIGLVHHDMPPSAPSFHVTTAAFLYLRFHGPEKGYRGSYQKEFLQTIAERIIGWNADGKAVYLYFNNTLGDASGNLITLNSFL